jgi:hypothetical protein
MLNNIINKKIAVFFSNDLAITPISKRNFKNQNTFEF